MKPRILIVAGEQALAGTLAMVSRRLRLEPTVCFSARRAREVLLQTKFALVVLDLGLPEARGLELLRAGSDARVLVITAPANREDAVAAKQPGVAESLVKPLDLPQLERTLAALLSQPPRATAPVRPGPAAQEITATHRDLRAAVTEGRFQGDWYDRVKVLTVELPPLVQRREDLPALAAFFLGLLAPQPPPQLSAAALQLLQHYPWPGNVRELRNALATCATEVIQPHDLPREIRLYQPAESACSETLTAALAPWLGERLARGATYDEVRQDLETRVLRELLRRFDNKPSVLARELGMNRVTLLKKRRQMGLSPARSTR